MEAQQRGVTGECHAFGSFPVREGRGRTDEMVKWVEEGAVEER